MKKIILLVIFTIFSWSICFWATSSSSETTWTISTWIQTDSWLNFQIPCNPSSVTNWTVSSITCVITCNSWYNLSWNSCIAISSWWGGGWGGGGWSFAPQTTTNTWSNTSNTTVSTWITIIKDLNLVNQNNEISNISTLSINTLTWKYFVSVYDFQDKIRLLINWNAWVDKIYTNIVSKIDLNKLQNFALYDKTNLDLYNSTYNSLYLAVQSLNLYNSTKDEKYKTEYINLTKVINKNLSLLNNIESKYVKINTVYTIIDNDKRIINLFTKVQKAIVPKLDKILKDWKISKEDYKSNLDSYNNFVLYYSIFRKQKNIVAFNKSKESFYKVYLTIKNK